MKNNAFIVNFNNKRLSSMYPYPKVITNRFYLYAEMAFEFIIGTRITNKDLIDLCENPVSEFFQTY